jgi:hypothetical protein
MVAPPGLLCDSCAMGVEADRNARFAAREDFGTGVRLAAAATAVVLVAIALSGPFAALAEPLFAVPATGLAAGIAAFSLVWGGWALRTGGHGRMAPASVWPSAVRASGAIAVAGGLVAGGLSFALSALPWVLLAL